MNCRVWEELVQQHLDKDAGSDNLDVHLRTCPECASQQIVVHQFLRALDLLNPPPVPSSLGRRITKQLLFEVNQRRRKYSQNLFRSQLVAVAAMVLLALGFSFWPHSISTSHDEDLSGNRHEQVVTAPQVEPLRRSFEKAGIAVASLTSATADSTLTPPATLIPLVNPPTLESLTPEMTETGPFLEAPVEPLREASDRIADGLAPITNSARRAVSLFIRDLPMGRGSKVKNPG